MKLKKIVILLVILTFLLAFSSFTTSTIDGSTCVCGLHNTPSNYPSNYYAIKDVSVDAPEECDIMCYDEEGALREECYEDGKCQAMVAKWVHCIQIDLWWLVIKIEIFGSLKSP